MKARSGFTLTEMLVVISIMVLVTVAALPAILPALESRHLRDSARILQALVAGARDRSLAQDRRSGIRLLPDPDLPGTYNRLRRIGEPAPYVQGLVTASGDGFDGTNTGWTADLLVGARMRVGGVGPVYTVRQFTPPQHVAVDSPSILPTFVGSPAIPVFTGTIPGPRVPAAGAAYQLFPGPQPAEGSREELLPGNICIDLRPMPGAPQGVIFSQYLPKANPDGSIDLVFGAGGQVVGDAAVNSMIVLWIGEASANPPQSPSDVLANAAKALLLTISTRTGNVSTVDVNPDVSNYPFSLYANAQASTETGG